MAATDAGAAPSPHEIVASEGVRRLRAGYASLAAAILAVVAGVLPQAIYSDFPRVYLIESLRDVAGQPIGRDGLRTAQILFIDDHALSLLLVSVCQGISAALIGVLLVFVYDASIARGANTPRLARILAILGSAATSIGAIVLQVAVMINASDFAGASDHGTAAAHDALRGGVVVAASGIGFFGSLSVAAAFVLIAIGAMRVGLFTRFLGVLGAIVGALILLGPISGSPTFIVQAFWLGMAGVLLMGRWPGGMPPAWESGEARPWPSQQEIREAKERGRAGRPARGGGLFGGAAGRGRGASAPADVEGTAEAPAGGSSNGVATPVPSPATSARKKRKRRS
jgi:hypothetical protein